MVMINDNGMSAKLKAVGLRPTRQRIALAEILFGRGDQPLGDQHLGDQHVSDRHVTAEQLHGEAIGRDVAVSLATVYNTLHQFTGQGLLREVVVDSGRSYFDTNVDAHHHFFDPSRGELVDINRDAIPLGDLPPPPEGMVVDSVDIVVRLKPTGR
ncbi:MAG: transcriptional repressor [Rhodospirillaceae bacterium]|jgi:Fur family transcriptional regulator, iron response regulator|nr:transcriptional repressor [Rhodospirillaceae bacterium]